MSTLESAVSIRPYFNVTDENMEACKAFLAKFNERVPTEEKCLYYNFTFNVNVLACREAYADADGVLAHLDNCGALLGEFMSIVELTRIELHGPAEELEKLKEPLADMNPDYFVYECGIGR